MNYLDLNLIFVKNLQEITLSRKFVGVVFGSICDNVVGGIIIRAQSCFHCDVNMVVIIFPNS